MSCFVARVPHLSSDIPPSIFHGSIISEFLGIARCTYRLPEFIPRASEIYLKMVAQGGHSNKISQQIKKVFQRNPNKYQSSCTKIIELIRTK